MILYGKWRKFLFYIHFSSLADALRHILVLFECHFQIIYQSQFSVLTLAMIIFFLPYVHYYSIVKGTLKSIL